MPIFDLFGDMQRGAAAGATKSRRAVVYKADVHADVDAMNYKWGDVAMAGSPRSVVDAVQSDASEDHDGMLLERFADYRDAKLREELRFCLEDDTEEVGSDIQDNSRAYVYRFELQQGWRGSIEAVATRIHEYLVNGVLADWRKSCGLAGWADLEAEAESVLASLSDSLRSPSLVTPPMRPFGPAYRLWKK